MSWQGKMSLLTILGLNLSVAIKFIVEPRQLSRFYRRLRDKSALRVASLVAPTLVIVTYFCLLPIGAFAHALIPAAAWFNVFAGTVVSGDVVDRFRVARRSIDN